MKRRLTLRKSLCHFDSLYVKYSGHPMLAVCGQGMAKVRPAGSVGKRE
ncbi:hypothetical protein E2C01_085076 [Portunus trituberculatus]|uniref:Uncharacterized protein n=1 Tax=Portunus trituberculatus TaxID=210409 RepID=A0A5B7JAZ6_PORTR|nr:hypothetical protein [Portunus trituberculatus]